jgi:Predicted Fe-S oxidoreductases
MQFSLVKYNLMNKLYMLFFKKELLPPFPRYLTIEPSNICNLGCPVCPCTYGKKQRPMRMMSLKEFKNIIDEVKGFTKFLSLFHNGEPFLNKDILKMIGHAASKNMEVVVNTNGHFFESKAFVAELIQSGLSRLIVSVDGKDQETYSMYRKGRKLRKGYKRHKVGYTDEERTKISKTRSCITDIIDEV